MDTKDNPNGEINNSATVRMKYKPIIIHGVTRIALISAALIVLNTSLSGKLDFFLPAVFAARFQRVGQRKRNRMTCMEQPAARLLAAILSMWLLLITRTSSLSTR